MCERFPVPPLLRHAFGAGSAVGSTHWKQPCGVAIEPFGHIRAPASPRLRRRLRPAQYVGCRPVVPPPSSLPLVAQVGRKLPSFAPSFVRPRGAPSGAPRLTASVRAFTESARPLSPSGVSSVASLPRSRSVAPCPPFRRGRARFLCDPRSDQRRIPPTALYSPQPPPSPRGRGATFREPCRVAESRLEIPALILDKRPPPCPPSTHKIHILYNCQSEKKERFARFSFSPAWSITSFEKKSACLFLVWVRLFFSRTK